jgi:hypothetical protein
LGHKAAFIEYMFELRISKEFKTFICESEVSIFHSIVEKERINKPKIKITEGFDENQKPETLD